MNKYSKFNKILFGNVSLLVLLISLLIFLNTYSHPRVLQVMLAGEKDFALVKDQQIKIDFNRPIKKENINDYISITPNFEYRNLWSGNSLIIIPSTTLDSQTEYTIKIIKEIEDIYNDNFEKDYLFTFKTEIPQFAMIEKKFDSSLNTIATYNADLTNRKEIISDNNIKFYGINKNFTVIVTENNYTNNIKILNRATTEVQNFNLINVKINAFSFSTSLNKNEFAYTKQEVEVMENYYTPKSFSKAYIYSLDTKSEYEFNPEGTNYEVVALKYSNDGNSLLYKNSESFYTLAETNDKSNFTGIGRFLSEGNFNRDNTSIVFVAYDPLQTYSASQFLSIFDSNRLTTKIDNKNIPVLDPQFKHRTDEIVYAEKFKDMELTKGIYKIMQIDLLGNKSEIVSSDKYSLELPQPSPDDRYISIEQYTEINLKNFNATRSFGFQNKPASGSVLIYDTLNKKLYNNNLIGIDVKWL